MNVPQLIGMINEAGKLPPPPILRNAIENLVLDALRAEVLRRGPSVEFFRKMEGGGFAHERAATLYEWVVADAFANRTEDL